MKERFFLSLLLAACLALIVSCGPASTAMPSATSTPTAEVQGTVPPTPTPTNTPVPPTPTAEVQEVVPSTPWKADGLIGEGEYSHMAESAGVEFHWSNDDSYLYAAMAAGTSGWVAVGFDPEDRMQGANFIFGYVKDEEAFIQDMFGVRPSGPSAHPPDEKLGGTNDILEYVGQEEDGLTIIEFKIPLDSGDEYDKPLRSGESYGLILAVGPSDDFTAKHFSQGYGQIVID